MGGGGVGGGRGLAAGGWLSLPLRHRQQYCVTVSVIAIIE